MFNEEWPSKRFAEMANYFRNGLKHFKDSNPVTVPCEAAVEILDRAIDNYWALTGQESPLMRRFMEVAHGL